MRELTLRAVVLGGLITLVFTAANVYLGLRVGLTFATSIPAAVISMAVLRWFASSNILENNIVQTIASAAGTLAAIIFVLPGLVIVGWWSGFPYWTTAAATAVGGILGVMFSVPLRRALVVDTPLPYPEGVAAAEVLKVGAGSREGDIENEKGLRVIVVGALTAAAYSLIAKTRLLVEEAAHYFHVGPAATGISAGLSYALVGAGHLVGLSVGMALLVGLILGWWVLLPILTSGLPGPAEEVAGAVFASEVRFFGAGVIGVAAIWTLLRIIGPILKGIAGAMAASRLRASGAAEALPLVERDMPIRVVGAVILGSMVPIAVLLWLFIAGGPLEGAAVPLILGTLLFILVAGLIIASVCGYMAGLMGASNSPISGIGILAILAAALLLAAGFDGAAEGEIRALIAYALFATAIVFGIATISNDNLQDLKTGQLVGATPWRQQLALVYGVIFGSIVIPPVLEMLNAAYGFAGAPGAGDDALAAPQAGLISALATGVLGGDLNWRMIGFGVLAGIGAVILDAALGRAGKLRLPPLGIGIGVYLPMSVTLPVVIGAVLGKLYDRRAERSANPEFAKRMGVLLATGLIVGDSLLNVAFAGIVYYADEGAPLALVGPEFAPIALVAGTLVFVTLLALLYRSTARVRL
ncbi:OPT family oligopeptide transporter [Sphingosinicella terrae]|uniref:OPT family oligopeptide transporter n=1 Tax=Sphingosinicella terrae TaxID=2172047 RepID=UPI000E0CED29|nr:oligopeptide transporter, OPT family [Sphingosinicella terrae]